MTHTVPRPSRAYWACQIGGWGTVAALYIAIVLFLLPALDTNPPPGVPPPLPIDAHWAQVVLEFMVLGAAGLVLTHALRAYLHRHRWSRLGAPALLPRALVAGVLLGAPLALLESQLAVAPLLRQYGAATPAWAEALSRTLNWSILVWLWTFAYFVILGARRRRQAELRESELARALQAAELRLLKSQLNPHFLFNSLNSVRALIADDPGRAQDAVTKLARTLRYTLGSGQDEFVTVAQELEIVDDYLALEGLRLGTRLRVARDIAPDSRHARIPVMLLQTVVENAIKHGIAELEAGGELRIAARADGGALRIAVENPRPNGAAPANGSGIGLRNASERLRLLYGGVASLELDLTVPGHAAARIRVPLSP